MVALAAGGNNTCVVGASKTTRRGFCWGAGGQGQLGNGGNIDKSTPTAISGNEDVTAISISSNGGCIIAAGKGRCWGDTQLSGRIGANDNPPSSPIPIGVNTDYVLKKRGLLAISTDHNDTVAIAARVPTIPDVPLAHPFYQDIMWFAGFGITTGYADLTFKPSSLISRQAMASFLYRLSNISSDVDPTCANGPRIFEDVPKSSPFCGVIEWLAKADITNKTAPLFKPTEFVDRSTMAAWLFKFHHRDTAKPTCTGNARLFPGDVPKSHPQCGSIEWLAKTGITTGYADGKYHPKDGVSRAAMAAFYHRLTGLVTH